jgi:uncharacterized protein (DUF1697 family)
MLDFVREALITNKLMGAYLTRTQYQLVEIIKQFILGDKMLLLLFMKKMNKNDSYQYVAFLRGINVGGHMPIKMIDLKKAFENMGFENVKTLLTSGNVIFESEQTDKKALTAEIESLLKKAFEKDISVILRSMDYLKKLQSSEPFKGIKMAPNIRLYVTFLSEKALLHTITIPSTLQKEFRILHATPMEVFSVLDLSIGKGTPDAMKILEKEFGSNVTTRNWNTVLRVLKQKYGQT